MDFKIWLEDISQLPLTTATEQGIKFETGRPVTITYLRNNDVAPNLGSTYQQDIEPAGRYMIHNEEPGETGDYWEVGQITFRNPLVIAFNTGGFGGYDTGSWKYKLHEYYGGKTGKQLSRAILQDGYDGIVTVGPENSYTKEIVDLSVLR